MNTKPIILLVDDTPENLRVLGSLLEDLYEVRIATNGIDALSKIKESAPDLILLDIVMPGIDGYEVNRQLKANDFTKIIPVIFISALGMSEQKIQAFREGAVDYITKPFQADEVAARVRTHLQLSKLEDLKREIEERKLAEAAVIIEKQRADTYLELAQVILVAFDTNAKITLLNRKGYQTLGYEPGELEGQDWFKVCLPPEEYNAVFDVYNKIIAGEISPFSYYENNIVTKNGEHRLIAWHNTLVKDSLGNIVGSLSSGEDITERKFLEEQTKLLKDSIDVASDAAYWIDVEGRIAYVNNQGYKSLGYTKDELLQLNVSDINVNVTIQRWEEVWQTIKKTVTYTSETMHRRKDGTTFPVEIVSTYIKFGNKEFINGFARDITDRKKTELIIKESEERLQKLLSSVTDYIFSVKIENNVVTETIHSEGCKAITGYAAAEFLNDNLLWFTIIHDDDKTIVKEQIERLLNHKEANALEHRIWHKKGSVKWVLNTPVIQLNSENEIIGYHGLLADITERKLAEELVRESEERFRLVTTLSGHLVYDYYSNGDKLIWGGAIEQITGFTAIEYRHFGLPEWLEMIHPADRQATISQFKDFVYNSKPYHVEYRYLNKNGDYIWIEDKCFALIFEDKKVARAVGVMKDVSLSKMLERQILNSVIETEERERLHFSQELHDGLGPLISAAKMYVQWIAKPNANMDKTEILNDIEKLLDESSAAIREISFKLNPHILQNYGLIEAMNAYCEKVKESTKISIEINSASIYRFEEKVETIIYRVLCECINNTIKHANASKINIEMQYINEIILIDYSDNGRGFNVDEVIESHKGIGLMNMQSRLKSINGNIEIVSSYEKGTRINFQININHY